MLCLNTIFTVSLHGLNIKVLFTLSFLSIFTYTYIFCLQPTYYGVEELQKEAMSNCKTDARFAELYRKKEKLPNNLKYILLWTPNDYYPFPEFKLNKQAFIEYNCPIIDCYVTDDRKFFKDGLYRFDAIAFNGRNIDPYDLPKQRYNHQQYIYVNMESATNYPVCSEVFDNFFNQTFTYKLNSDFVHPYFQIRDVKGNPVGPKRIMHWSVNKAVVNRKLESNWKTKRKAVAWIVSHCHTINRRENLAFEISSQLKHYNLSLDIYGGCSQNKCSRSDSCWSSIGKKYYFYLAFENSHAEDYVTEKVLKPLQNNIVPIVFGGANYSRFLPPGSYLDASKLSVRNLVAKISKIISSKDLYKQFFKWKSKYIYINNSKALTDNICGLCSLLHNREKMRERRTYKTFRRWWLPGYRNICEGPLSYILEYLFGAPKLRNE